MGIPIHILYQFRFGFYGLMNLKKTICQKKNNFQFGFSIEKIVPLFGKLSLSQLLPLVFTQTLSILFGALAPTTTNLLLIPSKHGRERTQLPNRVHAQRIAYCIFQLLALIKLKLLLLLKITVHYFFTLLLNFPLCYLAQLRAIHVTFLVLRAGFGSVEVFVQGNSTIHSFILFAIAVHRVTPPSD